MSFHGGLTQKPEKGCAAGGVQQHDPAIAAGQNVVSSDVVKGEGKGREQGGEHADGVEAQFAPADDADDQSDSGHCQSDRRDPLQRELLQPAGDGVDQHPDRSCVLHDDCGGDVRSLNRQIIEIVGRGHAQNADQEELTHVSG